MLIAILAVMCCVTYCNTVQCYTTQYSSGATSEANRRELLLGQAPPWPSRLESLTPQCKELNESWT